MPFHGPGTAGILLHDNKPIHADAELRAAVESTTIMIPAIPKPQNKADVEGEFGKFAQQVGAVYLDDSSRENLKRSAVGEVARAYTAGVNHARRVELDGKSRILVLRDACPNPDKDKRFIEQLRVNHSKPRPKETLATQTIARKILNHPLCQDRCRLL